MDMTILMFAVQIGFYALLAITLVAAVGVVTLANLFHAALCLVGALIGIAGIYIALHADFLALVQILLYVGAVMTLVIFAIMLTERFGQQNAPAKNNLGLMAFAVAIVFAVALGGFLSKVAWPVRTATLAAKVRVADIGTALMRTYVFPFEIITLVLIVALVGAIVIAKKDKP